MLIQDQKQLFESSSELHAIYYKGKRVWPTTYRGRMDTAFYVENITNEVEDVKIQKQFYTSDQTYAGWAPSITIETSVDGYTWNLLGTTSKNPLHIYLQPGERVYLRSSAAQWAERIDYDSTSSLEDIHIHGVLWNSIVGCSKVGGNIMSLLYGSNFTGEETSWRGADYGFYSLFSDIKDTTSYNYTLKNAQFLILPCTIARQYCYAEMFLGCANLTGVPELPATTLRSYCYYQMFRNCVSLTYTPNLPATTTASYSYSYMFAGCTMLDAVGSINAVTVGERSFSYTFASCTSLKNSPSLSSVSTMGVGAFLGTFTKCSSLVSPPVLNALTLEVGCYYEMFKDCVSLTFAPILPAKTLVQNCYYQMFIGCESLNEVTCLAETIIGTSYWLSGVSNTGTFTKKSGVTWSTGTSGIPSGWTVVEQ